MNLMLKILLACLICLGVITILVLSLEWLF